VVIDEWLMLERDFFSLLIEILILVVICLLVGVRLVFVLSLVIVCLILWVCEWMECGI